MGKKLVCGVGINDAGYPVRPVRDGRQRSICPYYSRWYNMLKRCYSEKALGVEKSYRGTVVCDDWLIFSNFRGWMETQEWEGKELDKDLRKGRCKLYSPSTCLFVEPKVNKALEYKNGSRSGVTKYKGRYCVTIGVGDRNSVKNLGCFLNAQDAYNAYYKGKAEYLVELANEQSCMITREALLRVSRDVRTGDWFTDGCS